MKNIVLFGPPRSGKTSLSKKIIKEFNNFSLISQDNFKASFMRTCEELDITSINIAIPIKQTINYFLECIYYENDINYVVDLTDYEDDFIDKIKDNCIILFLGYSNLTNEELYNNIRKYDKENDWTYTEPDNRLNVYCDFFIKESKKLEQIAKDNNYWYVDVSKDREEVLNETFKKIKDMLGEK